MGDLLTWADMPRCLRRIKRSYVRPSLVFPPKYTIFVYKEFYILAHTHLNVAVNIIISQLSKSIPFISFLLSLLMPVNGLRCKVGPIGLGHSIKTMPLQRRMAPSWWGCVCAVCFASQKPSKMEFFPSPERT